MVVVDAQGRVVDSISLVDEDSLERAIAKASSINVLIGDASKARARLGWKPKTSFAQLVQEMVASDLKIARQEIANGKNSV